MLTYKKALSVVEGASVKFYLEYLKTVDIKTAMSRKQGSRHPQLTSVQFVFSDGVVTCYPFFGDEVEFTIHSDFADDDIRNQAVTLLVPEILENYIENTESEIEE